MSIEYSLLGILLLINAVALFLIASDKRRAVKGLGSDRLPEGWLFFMAAIGGAIGVYIGMVLFRHKTKKWYFTLGMPLLVFQNVATLYLMRELLLVQV